MLCYRLALILVLFSLATGTHANEKSDKNSEPSVVDVSIIGNSELPRLNFNLPWRLPTVENRTEQSPSIEIRYIYAPIEPEKHRQLVHFERYLEVDLPSFRTR